MAVPGKTYRTKGSTTEADGQRVRFKADATRFSALQALLARLVLHDLPAQHDADA